MAERTEQAGQQWYLVRFMDVDGSVSVCFRVSAATELEAVHEASQALARLVGATGGVTRFRFQGVKLANGGRA